MNSRAFHELNYRRVTCHLTQYFTSLPGTMLVDVFRPEITILNAPSRAIYIAPLSTLAICLKESCQELWFLCIGVCQ